MHNNLIRPWQFDKTYGTFYILLLFLLINLNWTRFYSILWMGTWTCLISGFFSRNWIFFMLWMFNPCPFLGHASWGFIVLTNIIFFNQSKEVIGLCIYMDLWEKKNQDSDQIDGSIINEFEYFGYPI